MTLTLDKTQERLVHRLVRAGKFESEVAVVREALRLLTTSGMDYLTPPKLTRAQVLRIYSLDEAGDARERSFGRAAFASVRRAARNGRRP